MHNMRKDISKFRGRSENTGQWVYGCLVANKIMAHIHEEYGTITSVDPETVGAYTGLVDNKGIEVYEGDIIKAPGHPEITKKEYLNQKYVMEWDSVHVKWWAKPLAKKYQSAFYLPYLCKDAYIVGNIHD